MPAATLNTSVDEVNAAPVHHFPLDTCWIERRTEPTPRGSLALPQILRRPDNRCSRATALYEPLFSGKLSTSTGGVVSTVHWRDVAELVPLPLLASTLNVCAPIRQTV